MKQMLIVLLFLLATITGCSKTPEPAPSEGVIPDDKLITKNASELVLTLEDVGEGWILKNNYQIDEGWYAAIYKSEESWAGGERYGLTSSVRIFPGIEDARAFYEESKLIDGTSSVNIGDESIMYFEKYLGVIIFRENNIVVDISYNDDYGELDKSKLIYYAKIVEQKIANADP